MIVNIIILKLNHFLAILFDGGVNESFNKRSQTSIMYIHRHQQLGILSILILTLSECFQRITK
jgi:hypothetical protein